MARVLIVLSVYRCRRTQEHSASSVLLDFLCQSSSSLFSLPSSPDDDRFSFSHSADPVIAGRDFCELLSLSLFLASILSLCFMTAAPAA